MREIKFRGKHCKRGDWLYGDLRKKEGYDGNPVITVDGWVVDENTVGQFTGLYDKHNREIYEGDILKRTVAKENGFGDFIGVVDYKAGGFILNEEYGYCPFHDIFGSTYEVIGNIYDNPEFLEVKDENV